MKVNPQVFVSQLAGELWVMEPRRLERFLADLHSAAVELDASIIEAAKGGSEADAGPGYSVKSGVAHIPIAGPILKEIPCVFSFFGIKATGTRDTQAALARALADDDVGSIVLDVDSPGGTLAGVQDLAGDIRNARGSKPIRADVSDLAVSAAYWIAAQADSITANRSAVIGSIGVYTVAVDSSEAAEAQGVKVHVIRSANLKGSGVPGAPISDKEIAEHQRLIDQAAAMFVEAVAAGRDQKRAAVEKSATGQVWFAEEAKSRGLIDEVRASPEIAKDEDEDDEQENPDPDAPEDGDDEEKKKMAGTKATAPVTDPAAQSEVDQAIELASETEKRAAAAEEQRDAALAELATLKQTACLDVIEQAVAEGRILPPARAEAEAVAESVGFDAARVRQFVKAFTPQISPTAQSSTPAEENADEPIVTTDERTVLDMLGISADDLAKYGDVHSITIDGRHINADGEDLLQ